VRDDDLWGVDPGFRAALARGLGVQEATPNHRAPLRDRLLTVDQLREMPAPAPLVDGLLYRDTLAEMSGAPGCYKSFIALGISCAVSAGVSWEGHAVPEALPVIYVAAEGACGLARRADAWAESNRRNIGELHVLPEPLQLGNAEQVAELVQLAREMRPGLVVLDTRARCTVGLDENSATAQGLAVEAAESIRRACGATVLLVHHTGRQGEHGRGSNAWDGAAWTLLSVTGAELHAQIKVEKHKDVPDGANFHYRMLPYVVSAERMPATTESERSTLVAIQNGFRTEDLLKRPSVRDVTEIIRTSAGLEGLTRSQIVQLAEERKVGKSAAYEAVNVLVRDHIVRNIGSDTRPRYVVPTPSGGTP
jgi:AAA domain